MYLCRIIHLARMLPWLERLNFHLEAPLATPRLLPYQALRREAVSATFSHNLATKRMQSTRQFAIMPSLRIVLLIYSRFFYQLILLSHLTLLLTVRLEKMVASTTELVEHIPTYPRLE
jgi:hypothetical protein